MQTSTVRSLAPMLRLHKWAFPSIVLLGVLQSLSEGFGIGLFIPLLHGLVGGTPPTRGGWLVGRMDGLFQHIPADERQAVIALCLFAVVLATATLSYTHGILFTWVDGRIAHQLRGRIFDQLLTVGFGAIERDRSGRLLNVLASDTWRTSEALKILVHLIITTSTVIVYVVLLLLMSWRLTLVVALGMLLVSGVVRLFTKGARELGESVTRSNSELAHRMVEGIDGMRVIRAYGREPYEQRRFDVASDRLRQAILRMGYIEGAVHPVHEILIAGLLLAILFVTARSATDMSLLLVFVFVLYRLQPRVKDFEACRVLATTTLSASRVQRDEPPLPMTWRGSSSQRVTRQVLSNPAPASTGSRTSSSTTLPAAVRSRNSSRGDSPDSARSPVIRDRRRFGATACQPELGVIAIPATSPIKVYRLGRGHYRPASWVLRLLALPHT